MSNVTVKLRWFWFFNKNLLRNHIKITLYSLHAFEQQLLKFNYFLIPKLVYLFIAPQMGFH